MVSDVTLLVVWGVMRQSTDIVLGRTGSLPQILGLGIVGGGSGEFVLW